MRVLYAAGDEKQNFERQKGYATAEYIEQSQHITASKK